MPDAHVATSLNIVAHRNIVYATAVRFEPPVRVTTERVAASAVQCPQVPGLLEQAMGTGSLNMSEDCLTLNVFTPATAAHSGSAKLPVLVWIHGGAFTNGTANASWYDGSNLATRGCVVVTINYRLGALGFTGAEDIGLQDQVAALQWVRDNVARFGGDATNVTIFGESAGGCSVLALMATPAAEQLFHRAWAMSPSIGQLRTTERAAQSHALLLNELQVASLDAARTSPIDDVLAAQANLLRDPKDVVTMFSPTIGGAVLPVDAHARIHRDQRPLVIGTLRDESRLWVALNPTSANLTEAEVRQHYEQRFGADAERAWKAYRDLRPNSSPAQMLAALQSDESFRAPAWRVIDSRDATGAPTWSYFFTWPTPVFDGVLGACHGLDIPFVFDNISVPGVEMFIGQSQAHRPIADVLAGALVQFAHRGIAPWHHTDGKRTTMQIDERSEVVVDPERPLYDVWNR